LLLAQDLLDLRAVVGPDPLAHLIENLEDCGGLLGRPVGGQLDRCACSMASDAGRWCVAPASHDLAGLVRAGLRSAAFCSARARASLSR
jgi:hypothetical protein